MSAVFSNLVQALPEAPSSAEPAWLSELRSTATRELRERGLPTRKTEAWRFTPLKSLQGPMFGIPSTGPVPATEPEPGRMIAVNGKLATIGAVPDGVRVRRLSEVLDDDPESVQGHLGALSSPRDFSALNAALFADGLVVEIAPGTRLSDPLWIDHHAWAEEATVVYPRVLVLVGEGAECTLGESFVGEPTSPHLRDEVMEIRVHRGAQMKHVRVHHGHARRSHLTELAVSVDADARYEFASVVLGGSLVRLSLNVGLQGRGAETELNGVYLANDGDVVDHHTKVEHWEGHCQSNQSFRGVLAGRGHGVFDGIIVVHRDAQRTDAHMQNRNLLLSDAATIHTKPHLEIDADDVACSHGATIGALDEDQLFYLRTRGIPEDTAKAMLTYAFIRENIEHLPSEALREEISTAVLEWLPTGTLVREMLA